MVLALEKLSARIDVALNNVAAETGRRSDGAFEIHRRSGLSRRASSGQASRARRRRQTNPVECRAPSDKLR